MVFDEEELAKLRKNAPDFKESYDMGTCSHGHALRRRVDALYRIR